MAVQPIPPGYRSVTPYLCVGGAARAIAFYVQAFGAKERMRLVTPAGTVGHAEIEIGDSLVMLGDPWPEGGFVPPQEETAGVMVHLYVEDADAVFAAAVAAGASVVQPMETRFYGDRGGTIRDPFGQRWHVSSHVEDVSEEEVRRRLAAMSAADA
ncbi:VOC family protein [Roseomonas eburnea]|uniref:VOC family protein n=1 Tax=Neoroseomonas eburnea TaxID=1346889 RepID=A0A9X9X7E6_9PROT|nr:VOC family protein [Neoroseomonas eburnea]MBR0679632.1 VOC family protein [Neoroseomonas eburnea]